jgi:hypothetical protein
VRRLLLTAAVFAVGAAFVAAQDKPRKDSPAAASTRKKLQTKVTVDYKDERLDDVVKDLKNQVENLSIWIDKEGGVSLNMTITYKATDQPLAEVLDTMFKKNDLGYLIGQQKDKRYDGWLIIKKGKFRGDEDTGKAAAKPAPAKPKETTKPQPEDKDKSKAEDSADKLEQEAARKLKFAKMFEADGLVDKAKEKYKEIVEKYPATQAAKEAEKLLKK